MKRDLTKLLIICLTIFIASCSKEESSQQPEFEISQEIKDLIYFKGDEASSIVLINTQGGPQTELATNQFDQVLELVNSDNILAVNVHQAQTYTPNIFTNNDITFSQAENYDAESIEILYKVIKYFKDQNRTIYIIGISFGAFMTQELITKKGIDVADKYLIMVGRLDINEMYWQGFSEGKAGYFINGITPVLVDQNEVVNRNMSRLAAGLGQNRYTQNLNTIEDLSKITYVYGEKDDAVGKLTTEEIQFLQSKNVNIIHANGGHRATIENYILQGMKEAFGIE